jgi:hypothetical protein
MIRLAALLLILGACAPQTAQVGQVSAAPPPPVSPQTCQAAGGVMTKVCRRQVERCVISYKDAGKACTDKAQCQGLCLHDGKAPKPDGSVTGTCQATDNPCGCFKPVEKGKLSDRARCVD